MKHLLTATVSALLLASPAVAQDVGSATTEKLSSAYTGKAYSPYAKRTFPELPLWGETHLHTSLSIDARAFGNRLGPRDAYRVARGEEIIASSGQPVRLSRPLDWLVIADHTDGIGMMSDIIAASPLVTQYEQGARWSRAIRSGGEEAVKATMDLIGTFAQGKMDPELLAHFSPGSRRYATIWEDCIQAAEEFNDPGRFTTLIGFEWTSLVKGGNMHRNVIFRDGADRVRQVVPYTTQPPIGSTDPLDLYKYLENYEAKTNGAVLATAHNGNLSNGIMFPVDAQYTGRKLDKFYVEQRAKWERMYEITQNFGDGEAHPSLSPADEFADYGTWDFGNLDFSEVKTKDMLQYEYAREALKNGLALEAKLGTNPYKFGIQGATDFHTSLPTAEEDNFFGKHTGYEPSPERLTRPLMENKNGVVHSWQQLASGLTAVWAHENTRTSIFDAMDRKEVYATTGPRMMVRFFGGWDYTEQDLNSRHPAFAGYAKGVPMGGDLTKAPEGKTPIFMVYALRDPIGANIDRIQIVKGWLDAKGKTHEKVYDVVWSGDRKADSKGKLPAVGNTVDVKNANWTNTIGTAELGTVWRDPDFDPNQRAFYYARVLEIPTPPWYVYDAFRYEVNIPKDAPTSQQERAYTTPIWYTPNG
jgi:opacity protein-like surface antigen